MPDSRPPLLITRPIAGAVRFAEAFAARFGDDWPILLSPLIELRPTGAELPEADTYIFTSEQAIFAIPPQPGKPAWCVGMRTAEAARAAGFDAIEGPGDVAGLWRMMLTEAPEERLLHVRGAEISAPLAEMLHDAGLDAREVIVYRQERLPLSEPAKQALTQSRAVLAPVFSPRTARALVAEAGERHAPIWLAAISPLVESVAAPLSAERSEIAEHPDAQGVLDALGRLLRVQ